jgi:hypothetical protein
MPRHPALHGGGQATAVCKEKTPYKHNFSTIALHSPGSREKQLQTGTGCVIVTTLLYVHRKHMMAALCDNGGLVSAREYGQLCTGKAYGY